MIRMPTLAVLLASLAGAGCNQPDEKAARAPSGSQPAATPVLPVPEPPLDRASILLMVARAASDFASGKDSAQTQRESDGKRFELRLRFGCPVEPESGTRTARFNEQDRVLRLRIEPEISKQTELLQSLEISGIEAVEGFWILRPWLLESTCPMASEPARPGEEMVPESKGGVIARPAIPSNALEPHIGIAAFYSADDSRTMRREGRAYEATVKLPSGTAPAQNGYDLVLSGRFSALPDGRVIACAGKGDRQPSCIISAKFDHVAFVRSDGAALAEWSFG